MDDLSDASLKSLKAVASELGLSAAEISAFGSRARKATFVAAILAARAGSLKRPRSESPEAQGAAAEAVAPAVIAAAVGAEAAAAAATNVDADDAAPPPKKKKKRVWRIVADEYSDEDMDAPEPSPEPSYLPATGVVNLARRGMVVITDWKEAQAINGLGSYGELTPQYRNKMNKRSKTLAPKWMKKQKLYLLLEEAMYLVNEGSLHISAGGGAARLESTGGSTVHPFGRSYKELRRKVQHAPFLTPWHRTIVEAAERGRTGASVGLEARAAAAAEGEATAAAAAVAAVVAAAPDAAAPVRRLSVDDCFSLRRHVDRLVVGQSLADVTATHTTAASSSYTMGGKKKKKGKKKKTQPGKKVHRPVPAPLLTPLEVWNIFCTMRGGAESFAISYATYREYRGRSWIPKSGINFGFEWVLYSGSTKAHHSVLCVHVVADRRRLLARQNNSESGGQARRGEEGEPSQGEEMSLTWTTLLRSVRIAESVKKKMMACSLVFPVDVNFSHFNCVEGAIFREVVATRFTAGGS